MAGRAASASAAGAARGARALWLRRVAKENEARGREGEGGRGGGGREVSGLRPFFVVEEADLRKNLQRDPECPEGVPQNAGFLPLVFLETQEGYQLQNGRATHVWDSHNSAMASFYCKLTIEGWTKELLVNLRPEKVKTHQWLVRHPSVPFLRASRSDDFIARKVKVRTGHPKLKDKVCQVGTSPIGTKGLCFDGSPWLHRAPKWENTGPCHPFFSSFGHQSGRSSTCPATSARHAACQKRAGLRSDRYDLRVDDNLALKVGMGRRTSNLLKRFFFLLSFSNFFCLRLSLFLFFFHIFPLLFSCLAVFLLLLLVSKGIDFTTGDHLSCFRELLLAELFFLFFLRPVGLTGTLSSSLFYVPSCWLERESISRLDTCLLF